LLVERRAIVGAIILTSVLAFPLISRRSPSYRTLEGQVYATMDPVRGPVSPLPGAVVSNDWDTATTTTDAAGRFAIRVRRVAGDEWVTVRVRVGGKEACQRLTGAIPDGYRVSLFLDGGFHRTQRCGGVRVGL
jgi:hypothetical protein